MAARKVPLTFVRNLASASASSGKSVKPPIQVFGLEGRYATALYTAAAKMNQLDGIEKDLATVKNALKSDKVLREFVLNPVIKRTVKVEACQQISSKLKLSSATGNLISLLAENGRLKNLDNIVQAFSTIMAAHRGDLTCQVVTAKNLDEETKTELQNVLKGFAKKGENIILEMKVDPTIIGGMIVSIGDKYVDMSIASKVKKYTEIIQASA